MKDCRGCCLGTQIRTEDSRKRMGWGREGERERETTPQSGPDFEAVVMLWERDTETLT